MISTNECPMQVLPRGINFQMILWSLVNNIRLHLILDNVNTFSKDLITFLQSTQLRNILSLWIAKCLPSTL